MVLNYIWISFFAIALVVAIFKAFSGTPEVFADIVTATFETSKQGVEISLGLIGILCLWMGLMKIGEKGGSIQLMSKAINPFFSKLFPDVPENHPARGSMLLNFAANMLGLDNAATPAGLKAMNQLQELNPIKDTASNAQIMFLVLNTSGLTLIPVTVMGFRSSAGAASPSDVFLPILISTFFASLIGLIGVSIYQKINLFNKVVLGYLGGLTIIIVGLLAYFSSLEPEALEAQSKLLSNVILYGIICSFIGMAFFRKVNVYEAFIDGAKGGFDIAVKIIPFLVAILISIAVFKASGAMNYLTDGLHYFFSLFFSDTAWVDGLPTAIMKPLSGSGARGMMFSSWDEFGVDSFVGKLTATFQGATDTTFYIIAVYFGSVAIKNTRYAIKVGLLADFAGIVAAIFVSYLFFESNVSYSKEEVVKIYAEAHYRNNTDIIEPYLAKDIILIDQSYDTIISGKKDFLDHIVSADSTTFLKSNLVEEIMYIKTDMNGKIQSYKMYFDKREVVKVELLGDFQPTK